MKHSPEFFIATDAENLPGTLNIVPQEIGTDSARLTMSLTAKHRNLRGYVHGGSIVTLADTAAGYATQANLPPAAEGFTTIELKCNFMRAVTTGTLTCQARCVHRGKTTQVWDATVTESTHDKIIAEFRCTQIILYPRDSQ